MQIRPFNSQPQVLTASVQQKRCRSFSHLQFGARKQRAASTSEQVAEDSSHRFAKTLFENTKQFLGRQTLLVDQPWKKRLLGSALALVSIPLMHFGVGIATAGLAFWLFIQANRQGKVKSFEAQQEELLNRLEKALPKQEPEALREVFKSAMRASLQDFEKERRLPLPKQHVLDFYTQLLERFESKALKSPSNLERFSEKDLLKEQDLFFKASMDRLMAEKAALDG